VAIVLVINPRSDADFVREADRLAGDGMTQPGLLQAALRGSYPQAAVHARQLSGEAATVWYVYRDGRWLPDVEA
jgi:hypothetical protein